MGFRSLPNVISYAQLPRVTVARRGVAGKTAVSETAIMKEPAMKIPVQPVIVGDKPFDARTIGDDEIPMVADSGSKSISGSDPS